MPQFPNISLAIIVDETNGSGGAGKSFPERESLTSARRIAHSMSHLFGETIIITENISDFERLGFRVYTNIKNNKGDLAQIHFALTQTNGSATLVASTNLDFVSAASAIRLASIFTMKSIEVVIAMENEKVEPLFAVYSHEGLPLISELLMKSKSISVRDYLESVNTQLVDLSKGEKLLKNYTNTNSPFEIEDLTKKTKSKKQKESGDWFA